MRSNVLSGETDTCESSTTIFLSCYMYGACTHEPHVQQTQWMIFPVRDASQAPQDHNYTPFIPWLTQHIATPFLSTDPPSLHRF